MSAKRRQGSSQKKYATDRKFRPFTALFEEKNSAQEDADVIHAGRDPVAEECAAGSGEIQDDA